MKIECKKHDATIELDGRVGTVFMPGEEIMFIWNDGDGITRSLLNYGDQTFVTDFNAAIRKALEARA